MRFLRSVAAVLLSLALLSWPQISFGGPIDRIGEYPKEVLKNDRVIVLQYDTPLTDARFTESIVEEALTTFLLALLPDCGLSAIVSSISTVLNLIDSWLDPTVIIAAGDTFDGFTGTMNENLGHTGAVVGLNFIGCATYDRDHPPQNWTNLYLEISGPFGYHDQVLLMTGEELAQLDPLYSYLIIPRVYLSTAGLPDGEPPMGDIWACELKVWVEHNHPVSGKPVELHARTVTIEIPPISHVYSDADFEGTWRMHSVVTVAPPDNQQWIGYEQTGERIKDSSGSSLNCCNNDGGLECGCRDCANDLNTDKYGNITGGGYRTWMDCSSDPLAWVITTYGHTGQFISPKFFKLHTTTLNYWEDFPDFTWVYEFAVTYEKMDPQTAGGDHPLKPWEKIGRPLPFPAP